MEHTYAQYKEMLADSPVPSAVDYSYKKALQKLEKLQQYEDALVSLYHVLIEGCQCVILFMCILKCVF